MNREEAKNKVMTIYGSLSEELKQAIDVLVDAPKSEWEQMGEIGNLFAEATKDCISRKAVEEITWEEPDYSDKYNVLTWVRDKVRELPSATPDLSEYSDKLYKLAYERGKADVQEAEEEPCEDFKQKAGVVIEQLRADRDRLATALEEIEKEISELPNQNPSYWHDCDVLEREDVLEIIRKHRKEEE